MPKSKKQAVHPDLNPYKYEFTHEEIEILGKRLAGLIADKVKAQENKSAVTAKYNAEIKDLDTDIAEVAGHIRKGYEMREPQQGEIVFKDGDGPEEGLTDTDADRLMEGEVVDAELTEEQANELAQEQVASE